MPVELKNRLTLPVIAAPMTGVSGPRLAAAAACNGIIGAFPVHNAVTLDELDRWLTWIREQCDAQDGPTAPIAPNLIVHPSNTRLAAQLDHVRKHGVTMVITSVGSPERVVPALHDAGILVFSDVASERHAHRAIEADVDGLVLLSAGAGGQTGWANPFAFIRAVRRFYDGAIVQAGGITDGTSILAAQALGADLVYLGTRFIATDESLASDPYRRALVDSSLDDIRTTDAIGGLPSNVLASWLESHVPESDQRSAAGYSQDRLLASADAWGAGHSVSGVSAVTSVHDLVAELRSDYARAERELYDRLSDSVVGQTR